MSKLIIKQYCNQSITFDPSEDVLINLTEMAKVNGKEVKRWLELDSTKRYIEALAQRTGKTTFDFIIIKQGNNGGTWANRKVAIRFAQWLSDDFAIWVDTQIEELLLNRNNQPSYMLNDPIERAKVWILEEEERQQLKAVNCALMHINKKYTTGEIAKELGITSAKALNRMLYEKGIQFYQNGTWIPYAKYAELGLTDIKNDIAPNGHVYYDRKWTQKGRAFILALFQDGRAA